MRRSLTLGLVLASLAEAPAAYAAPLFTGLGDLSGGSFRSDARGVSADGSVVVGAGRSAAGQEAFRWSEATGMVGLGDFPGGNFSSGAQASSADGSVVVGDGRMGGTGPIQAFRWTQSTGLVSLGLLTPGGYSVALDVSDDGSIVVGQTDVQGFRWTAQTGMVGLGDLPGGASYSEANGISGDGQVIVGLAQTDQGSRAIRWTETTGMVELSDDLVDSYQSRALAASWDGSVIVGTRNSSGQAFRWTEADGIVGLPSLPGGAVPTESFDVSADGSIIVGRASFSNIAFIWDAEHGTRALRDVLANDFGLDLTGWTLTEAWGVSADGLTIVGVGTNPSGATEAFLAIIPEPSTALLFGAGLAGLALGRPRRASVALATSCMHRDSRCAGPSADPGANPPRQTARNEAN